MFLLLKQVWKMRLKLQKYLSAAGSLPAALTEWLSDRMLVLPSHCTEWCSSDGVPCSSVGSGAVLFWCYARKSKWAGSKGWLCTGVSSLFPLKLCFLLVLALFQLLSSTKRKQLDKRGFLFFHFQLLIEMGLISFLCPFQMLPLIFLIT